jgi:shikimate kinase
MRDVPVAFPGAAESSRRRYRRRVRRILVTGMSGTGKSTALAELAAQGLAVVDTDDPGWKERRGGEWVWREDRMAELLADDGATTLYVSGCVSNQGAFYDRFDAVVLLSAPADVILDRIENRKTNPYGKGPGEREAILGDLAAVEPRLRATCTHELDAAWPLPRIVEALVAIGRDG